MPLAELLALLNPKDRRGSKPRCHLLTHGTREQVAGRLTALIAPWGFVEPTDQWMPKGFDNPREARLDRAPQLLQDDGVRNDLRSWWLATPERRANTPNWDIASACHIRNRPGILLVEAKAYDEELIRQEQGKAQEPDATVASWANHERIGQAIAQANAGLVEATGLAWHLSRDSHYQMSNRFAWCYKLTELQFTVILVYLAFLDATEMANRGNTFATLEGWTELVHDHNQPLFPEQVWNNAWTIHRQECVPIIKAINQPLDLPPEEAEA